MEKRDGGFVLVSEVVRVKGLGGWNDSVEYYVEEVWYCKEVE